MYLKENEKLYIGIDEFLMVKKIHLNRPIGNEGLEECHKYGYSRQMVDSASRYFLKLKKEICKDIKNGSFLNEKIFIIGQIKGEDGIYYLVDGQHMGAIYVELIEEGILPRDFKFFYELNTYNSYEEMVVRLGILNKNKSWNYIDHSSAKSRDSEGYKEYCSLADKYYGVLDDGVIKQCIFGQQNGLNIFDKKMSNFRNELLELTKYFLKLAEEDMGRYFSKNDVKRFIGVSHAASCFRDLQRIIFRTINEKYEEFEEDEVKKFGLEICQNLIDGVLGKNSKMGTDYTGFTAKSLFSLNNNANFKKTFVDLYNEGGIRLCKRTSKKFNDKIEIVDEAISKWKRG